MVRHALRAALVRGSLLWLAVAPLLGACAHTTLPKPVACAVPAVEQILAQAVACYQQGSSAAACAALAGVEQLGPYLSCLERSNALRRK